MTKKQVLALGGLFLFLLAALALIKTGSGDAPPARLCDAATASSASSIEILQPDAPAIKFVRGASGWEELYPLHYRADPVELDNFAANICAMKVSQRLYSGREGLGRFALEAADAVRVRLSNGGAHPLLEFDAGKASSPDSFFVRIFSTPDGEVREADGLRRESLSLPFAQWLDKTIYAALPESITSFTWKRGGQQWTAEKRGGIWQLERGGKTSRLGPASGAAVLALARMLADFRADTVLPAQGDGAPAFREDFSVEITAGGRPNQILLVGSGQDGAPLVKKSGEDRVVFAVQKWKAQKLLEDFYHLRG